VLKAAGLTLVFPSMPTEHTIEQVIASPPIEWEPRPSFLFPEHKSQSSGFDGRTQFWRCSCGWEVHVPITSEQSAQQHNAAINVTFGAFQAHKIASSGHG
jgi:hypothetical protein